MDRPGYRRTFDNPRKRCCRVWVTPSSPDRDSVNIFILIPSGRTASGYLPVYSAADVTELQQILAGDVRNDAVGVRGTLSGGNKDVEIALESTSLDSVVRYRKYLTVRVK